MSEQGRGGAMVACRSCGQPISERAAHCPVCGEPARAEVVNFWTRWEHWIGPRWNRLPALAQIALFGVLMAVAVALAVVWL